MPEVTAPSPAPSPAPSSAQPPASPAARDGRVTHTRGLTVRLGLRALVREWRSGELSVLAGALIIAVTGIVAVSAFTDRMDRGMQAGANELLAADLLLRSTDPIDARFEQHAKTQRLRTARTLSFRSVVVAGEALRLSRIKAVSEAYPLRGELRTAAAPYAPGQQQAGIPPAGTVWVEARLLGLLGVDIGDALTLGERAFRIDRVLTFEPDRGGDLFNIAPRLLMRLDEVDSTGLVQPASRVRHALLFAAAADRIGASAEIEALREWLSSNLAAGQELQGVSDARPEFRTALERANQFLGLAAMVSVLLACVAIALAARRHAHRHLDTAAMLRCLGLSQRGVLAVLTVQLVALGLAASLVGCVLGYLAQFGLSAMLSVMLVASLPPPGFEPALHGMSVGLLCLAGFALPPVADVRRVPPLRVLRRDLGPVGVSTVTTYMLAASALLTIVVWQARDPVLAVYVVGGGAATVAVLGAIAWLFVSALSRLRTGTGGTWRLGLANIARRKGASVAQIVAFGLGLMVLLLLLLVRNDLLDTWMENLPPGTPNFFLVNVQPAETTPLGEFLADKDIDFGRLYPMVRGRLTALNGRAVVPEQFTNPRSQRLAARDFNLSWAADLPPGNQLSAGAYWSGEAAAGDQVSVEEGLAEALGIGLGDVVEFTIAGQARSARVTSLRKVQWDSFDVNFFVLFPPQGLADAPATFISSFHVDTASRPVLVDLVQRFPSVTTIDVAALLTKVRELMNQANLAVQYVFGFTLLAGFAVLFAAIQSTLDERRHEAAIVRTLGASRDRVSRALITEFAVLGLLAGGLAALAASAISAVIAQKVLHLPFHINGWVWLAGLALGAVGVAVGGWMGTRSVLRQPPLTTLRQG